MGREDKPVPIYQWTELSCHPKPYIDGRDVVPDYAPATIPSCDECVLFRSVRRKDQAPPEDDAESSAEALPRCKCVSKPLATHCHKLDYWCPDPSEGAAGFDNYKKAIVDQLELRKDFVLRPFLKLASENHDPSDFFIRIVIDIVAEGAATEELQEGVNVAGVCAEHQSKLDRVFIRWRDTLKSPGGYLPIRLTIDFKVHYRKDEVHFTLHMGLPYKVRRFKRSSTDRKLQAGDRSPKSWEHEIRDALSDSVPTNISRPLGFPSNNSYPQYFPDYLSYNSSNSFGPYHPSNPGRPLIPGASPPPPLLNAYHPSSPTPPLGQLNTHPHSAKYHR